MQAVGNRQRRWTRHHTPPLLTGRGRLGGDSQGEGAPQPRPCGHRALCPALLVRTGRPTRGQGHVGGGSRPSLHERPLCRIPLRLDVLHKGLCSDGGGWGVRKSRLGPQQPASGHGGLSLVGGF